MKKVYELEYKDFLEEPDDICINDWFLEKKNGYDIPVEFNIKCFKSYHNIYEELETLFLWRTNSRSIKKYKYAINFNQEFDNDEYNNYGIGVRFNLIIEDKPFRLKDLSIDLEKNYIVKNYKDYYEIKLFLRYSYEYLSYIDQLKKNDSIEMVDAKAINGFIDYGPTYSFSANNYKLNFGDIVNVTGQFSSREMVIVKGNYKTKKDDLDFDVYKLKSVSNLVEKKELEDKKIISYFNNKTIPNTLIKNRFELSIIAKYSEEFLKDNKFLVLGIKRKQGNKTYLFITNDPTLKKGQNLNNNDHKIRNTELDNLDMNEFYGTVDTEPIFINYKEIHVPLLRMPFLIKKSS